jgi:hypothetical protein
MDRDSFSHDQDLIEILKGLESKKAEYPPELLEARRKLFIEQLEQQTQLEAVNQVTAKNQTLMEIFRKLKALDPEYPPEKRARRRLIFRDQIEEISRTSVWNVLRSSIRIIFASLVSSSHTTSTKFRRASVIAAGVAMLAFVAYALYGNVIPSATAFLSQNEIPPAVGSSQTPTPQAEIICQDGYEPPLCLAPELDNSQDLTDPGNGKARPAVAKDTRPGFENIHRAAHVNDGLYGPGASWVSNSPNSWIKIDLGDATEIDTVAFSRDRLGTLNDGDPGQFVIAVAMADDIYADGNSSNDEREYINVYNSRQKGFDGTISGPEKVIASFKLQKARFIKITFENAGTAIDEIDAFVSKPSQADRAPTKASPRDETSPSISTSTPLPMPTDTALPVDTATAIVLPTDTPLPVDTATPVPTAPVDTDTPVPTDPPTAEVIPEDTAVPTQAIVPLPVDDSLFPPPIDVPVPLPTTEQPIPAC